MVTFPIVDDKDGAAFVAWTTTPWTLPSNLALCVNSNFVYVKVKSKSNGKIYVVAESLLSKLPTEMPKEGTPNASTVGKAKNATDAYDIVEKFPGSSLVGTKYEPVFEYFNDFTDAFRVVADDYVTATSGTGVVHLAPQFGEDDLRVCLKNHIINEGENLVMPVNDDGCFTEQITRFRGHYIKHAEKDIIQAVKASINLSDQDKNVEQDTVRHSRIEASPFSSLTSNS
ncbi:isoleucine--tRNA ligase, cytoplasmic [Tanacetum coccineum]